MWGRLVHWWKRRRQARLDALMFEREINVEVGDSGISARYPDGRIEAIDWDEVECIAIETNDSGPWDTDFWWRVEGKDRRCVFPQGATGEMEAMRMFATRFPDFDHEAVIKANGSTTNDRFVCWERAGTL